MKKILIGMLASGEHEKEEALASIRAQAFDSYDIEVIEGLGNKEAHDALYSLFNQSADRYELFLKHDADMVFNTRSALKIIYQGITSAKNAQMMMMDVQDWLSGQLIPGQNVYRNTVRWQGNDDGLIVDYHGTAQGATLRVRDHPVPLVIHSPNPSPFQAFTFGLHRAEKVLQRGRKLHLHRALLHYTILASIWGQWQLHGDIRRLYALIGAQTAYDQPDLVQNGEYKQDDVYQYFLNEVQVRSEASMAKQSADYWGQAVKNQERWILRV